MLIEIIGIMALKSIFKSVKKCAIEFDKFAIELEQIKEIKGE